jgi:hypothetical protein
MNKPQNNNRTVEDQLADFTDQILAGTAEEGTDPLAPDPELRALQQTALRLKNAVPKDGPSEAVIYRMRQNIVMQREQQETKASEPFWQSFLSARKPSGRKWQSQHSRRRQNLRISLAAVVLLLIVSIPLMYKDTPVQPAASGQSLNASLLIAFGGLILLALLFFRRKR